MPASGSSVAARTNATSRPASANASSRSVAHDDEIPALGSLDELLDPLLRNEPAHEEELGRLGFAVARHGRELDAVPDHADVAYPEPAHRLSHRVRDGDGDARTVCERT